MNTLKLSTRLSLGFGLVLALLFVVAALGIARMSAIEQRLETIVEVNNAEAKLAVAMRISINQVATASRNIALLTEEAAKAAQRELVKKSRAAYDVAETELGKRFAADATTAERGLFDKTVALKVQARPLLDRFVALGLQNKAEEATRLLMAEVEPAQQRWLMALGEMAELQERHSVEAADAAKADHAAGRNLMLGTAALALLLGAGCAVWLTRGVSRQLGGDPADAVAAVRRIADGDLVTPVAVRTGDGTSVLAAMRQMQQSLLRVVETIRSGSEGIATGSGQIAAGSADLSQRTEEQASNLQQTAASMEQLHGTVQTSAETARQAARLAATASEVALQGGSVVERVVATMDEISASSRRIGDIIGTIDGIAFQTNILALNAAVEAARAGEQGRGFAVVAGEVRSLAQRSAEAAREIKALIGASVEKVEGGNALAAEAGRTMGDVVAQVRRVSDMIGQISAAAGEQTVGIGQVNEAVTQLDQVTQQNAALVEESAAAADSLRAQAARLVETVAVFRTAGA